MRLSCGVWWARHAGAEQRRAAWQLRRVFFQVRRGHYSQNLVHLETHKIDFLFRAVHIYVYAVYQALGLVNAGRPMATELPHIH